MSSLEDVFALDLETKTLVQGQDQHALEPWRYKQGKATVTSCAIVGPNNFAVNKIDPGQEWFREQLKFLAGLGRPVFCHNALFDVSWAMLITDNFDLIKKIQWQDTGLLAKWLINSQASEKHTFSWSLKGLCTHFMEDHPRISEFEEMKSEEHVAGAEGSEQYWFDRGIFDAEMTRDLATELRRKLPESQRNGYSIEQATIPYVSRAWMNGIPINKEYMKTLEPKVQRAMVGIEKDIPINGAAVRSPTQLSNYLFNTCGLSPISRGKPTKKNPLGNGSTRAGDLKRLRIQQGNSPLGNLLGQCLDYKQLATLKSKYLDGFERSLNYTGEDAIYTSPRIFGTYTGRFTYSSKLFRKNEFQSSIATHQLPKVGPTKKCLVPPEDKWIIKCDGAQQELRLIAVVAPDKNLIAEFNSGVDVHSSMSAFIANSSYDEFMYKLSQDDPETKNYRYAGKLLNLSCQYRIGVKALMEKFFETYGIILTYGQAQFYLNLYKQRYPGVVEYWENVIEESKERGYTHSFADRRYYLTEWEHNGWGSESSAINEPIQGSAADHKELTLLLMSEKYPEVEFFLDIHDELCFYTPKDLDMVKAFSHDITNLTQEYRERWNIDIPLDLPFDTILCKENFKEGELILP
jgi:DNA polymerase I-like protein with 3'-5' exonuclease and polymerase domains